VETVPVRVLSERSCSKEISGWRRGRTCSVKRGLSKLNQTTDQAGAAAAWSSIHAIWSILPTRRRSRFPLVAIRWQKAQDVLLRYGNWKGP